MKVNWTISCTSLTTREINRAFWQTCQLISRYRTRRQELITRKVSIGKKKINANNFYSQENKTFNVPNDAAVQGHCSPVASEMALSWKEGKTDKNNTIKFTFVNDHTNFTVFSIELNVYKDKEKFPNGEQRNARL